MRTIHGLPFVALVLAACSGAPGDDPAVNATTQDMLSKASHNPVRYLGLGDSITFGDDDFVAYTPAARPNDKRFVGFADRVGDELYNDRYLNLGCPGETAASFSDVSAADNGCQALRAGIPASLHFRYHAGTSQLDETLTLLKANPSIKGISFTLGGNDLLLVQKACVAATPTDPSAIMGCLGEKVPGAIQAAVGSLVKIAATLRSGAGYKGKLVFVNIYPLQSGKDASGAFIDPTTSLIAAYNDAAAKTLAGFGVEVADAFSGFSKAAVGHGGDACAAGLLVQNPVSGALPACGIHPSAKGREILAKLTEAALK